MGRLAECLMEEIETVARMCNEEPREVHKEWKDAEAKGMSFGSFVVRKSRKRHRV